MSTTKTIQQMVDALASIANEPDRTLQQRPVRFAKAKEAIQAGRVLLEELKGQRPMTVEAVATIGRNNDELFVDWLIEGGLSAMVSGETLLVCAERLTDSTGSGEVYTQPQPAQPKKWVGLTDEDIYFVYMTAQPAIANETVKRVARAIEAKLKEKNT